MRSWSPVVVRCTSTMPSARDPGLEVVCTLHEQAAAIAAEAYWKASGDLALCLVTAGPGGTNAITGVAGGWLDSTPMVIVSGQVKRADLVGSTGVRQRGVQELDLVSIVRSITKYSAMVTEPATIRYHLERALHLATTGRPGPVWLDVPLDVQGATVNPATMSAFDPSELPVPTSILTPSEVMSAADSVLDMLEEAKRPLVLVGAGVRLAKAERRLLALLEAIGTPVITTWPAMGIVGEEHPLYVGRPGSLAPRGPNFALQASDVLLCLGARLDLVTTGYDPKDFGRAARKVVVDIDPNELAKLDGAIELPVCADVGTFIDALIERIAARPFARRDLGGWTSRCRSWRERYPLVTDAQRGPGDTVSTYYLAEVISGLLADDDVLVPCSSGLAIEILLLALRLRTGHRAIFTTALGAMGFGLPAAIGSCLATGRRRTICVEGDGGLQVNIQELETMRRLELPVKLFVLSNDGVRVDQSVPDTVVRETHRRRQLERDDAALAGRARRRVRARVRRHRRPPAARPAGTRRPVATGTGRMRSALAARGGTRTGPGERGAARRWDAVAST